MLALLNALTFIPRESHENLPNKCFRDTPLLFSNKAFHDFTDKISRRTDNKNKKDKKTKSYKPTKIFMTISSRSMPTGSAKWKHFQRLVKRRNDLSVPTTVKTINTK